MIDNEFETVKTIFRSPQEFTTQKCFLYSGTMAVMNPAFRIIKIDDDLLPIIEDTKPDFTDLKLKYPAIFVNHQISVGNAKINGFMIIDYDQMKGQDVAFGFVRDEYASPIRILCVGYDYDYDFEFYSINPIDEAVSKDRTYIENRKEKKQMEALAKRVRELACNLINILVNDEKEIEEVLVKVIPGQNEKREKRGKLPVRDITYLRIGGSLKKYAREYNQLRQSLSVRFHVGGFWRRLMHDRYKVKRKIYVKPHYRGMENMPDVTKTHVKVKKNEN